MQECMIVLGSCSFRESWEKIGSIVRSVPKKLEARGSRVFVSFISLGVVMMERKTQMEQHRSSCGA